MHVYEMAHNFEEIYRKLACDGLNFIARETNIIYKEG
jgi:hypothetical protein